MTIYYDRQGVVVTELQMTVGEDRFEVLSIDAVDVLERRRVRGAPAIWMLVLLPALTVWFSASVGKVVLGAAMALVLALGIIAAAVAMQFRPSRYELWIRYRGEGRAVYDTAEEWRAQQLARSLRRAIQAARLAFR